MPRRLSHRCESPEPFSRCEARPQWDHFSVAFLSLQSSSSPSSLFSFPFISCLFALQGSDFQGSQSQYLQLHSALGVRWILFLTIAHRFFLSPRLRFFSSFAIGHQPSSTRKDSLEPRKRSWDCDRCLFCLFLRSLLVVSPLFACSHTRFASMFFVSRPCHLSIMSQLSHFAPLFFISFVVRFSFPLFPDFHRCFSPGFWLPRVCEPSLLSPINWVYFNLEIWLSYRLPGPWS